MPTIISQNKYRKEILNNLNDYVKFLTPDIFLSLNQGEIFKLFNTNINYQYNSSSDEEFLYGAKTYKNILNTLKFDDVFPKIIKI